MYVGGKSQNPGQSQGGQGLWDPDKAKSMDPHLYPPPPAPIVQTLNLPAHPVWHFSLIPHCFFIFFNPSSFCKCQYPLASPQSSPPSFSLVPFSKNAWRWRRSNTPWTSAFPLLPMLLLVFSNVKLRLQTSAKSRLTCKVVGLFVCNGSWLQCKLNCL